MEGCELLNEGGLPNQETDESVSLVSDEVCLRDAGNTVETASDAPVGCRADEGEHSPAQDAGNVSSSLEAQGGTSDTSPVEITTPADAIKSRRDFEAFLRASGFSRAAARGLAASGWGSIADAPNGEGEEDQSEFVDQLLALKALFQ